MAKSRSTFRKGPRKATTGTGAVHRRTARGGIRK